MKGRYQLAVVDLLSAIADSAPMGQLVLARALAQHGVDATPDEIRSVLGLPLRRAVAALFRTGSRSVEGEALRQDVVHDHVVHALYTHYKRPGAVREVEGAGSTFATLRAQGLRVALATNLPRPVADVVLTNIAWIDRGLVDTTLTCDEVDDPRPQPGMIREAMARTGIVDAARVLKVGQTPADLAEGTLGRCGAVVGLTYGAHGREELYLRPHTHLVDRLPALADVVALAAVA